MWCSQRGDDLRASVPRLPREVINGFTRSVLIVRGLWRSRRRISTPFQRPVKTIGHCSAAVLLRSDDKEDRRLGPFSEAFFFLQQFSH